MMRNFLRCLIISLVCTIGCCSSLYALDLPTKKVKGVEYYYYKVKKGESIYGIAKNLGITPEQIRQYNPSAADGVKKGDMLIFPYADFNVPEPEIAQEVEEVLEEVIAEPETVETLEQEPIEKNAAIALLLPLGLNNETKTKNNQLALDFYKGFLIAADTLGSRAPQAQIIVKDSESLSLQELQDLVGMPGEVGDAAVIVAPWNDVRLPVICQAAAQRQTYVMNVFDMHDTTYLENPYVLQANIPAKAMYSRAIEGFLQQFQGYTPVVLRSESGKNEKEPFVKLLTDTVTTMGIKPIYITYESALLSADLEDLPSDGGQKYVFVPMSGSLQEFNKFAFVVKSFRDRLQAEAGQLDDQSKGAVAEIFGYPDWTAFRGDAMDTLHRLEATVYSRFFDDFTGFESRGIDEAFRYWFGAPYMESIPGYGILGYDTGTYLLKNLKANAGKFDPEFPRTFTGVQSTFDFKHSGQGYVNDALYIINYRPAGRVQARVL